MYLIKQYLTYRVLAFYKCEIKSWNIFPMIKHTNLAVSQRYTKTKDITIDSIHNITKWQFYQLQTLQLH